VEAEDESLKTNLEFKSNPEPFLHKAQKKSGTPRVSIVQGLTPVPRGWARHPPAKDKTLPRVLDGDSAHSRTPGA
jgi:hypothetical protein